MSKATGDGRFFRVSGFELLSDFDIRHSSLSCHNSNNSYEHYELKNKVSCRGRLFRRSAAWYRDVVGASGYDQNIEKDFPVSAGGKLIVQADRGSIEVNSDTSDKVQVRVLRHVKGG